MEVKTLPAAASVALAAALLAGGCSNEGTADVLADPVATELVSSTERQPTAPLVVAEPVAVSALSQVDADGLAFIREEEKLAGDVYRAMYEIWGLPIFANIADAETSHTDAVLELLNSYQLPDPAQGLAAGEFANPELQVLYDELVETGSQSVTDALQVGALIEELDITDLRLRETDQPDIDAVYANLERGSSNHLRAFNRQLENRDITYSPVSLDQDSFDLITSTSTPRGGNGR